MQVVPQQTLVGAPQKQLRIEALTQSKPPWWLPKLLQQQQVKTRQQKLQGGPRDKWYKMEMIAHQKLRARWLQKQQRL